LTKLATTEAVRRGGSYSHAVVSWIDADGYPTTVGTDFGTEPESSTVTLGPFHADLKPAAGQELCVTFSHIRPQKGVGYDERRYVNVWGEAAITGRNVELVATRAAGWDEAEVPFFEYAERNVPRARNYLMELGATVKLSPFCGRQGSQGRELNVVLLEVPRTGDLAIEQERVDRVRCLRVEHQRAQLFWQDERSTRMDQEHRVPHGEEPDRGWRLRIRQNGVREVNQVRPVLVAHRSQLHPVGNVAHLAHVDAHPARDVLE